MAEAATVIRAGIGVDVENAEIPSSFSWNMRCNTYEEYKTFITTIYGSLRVKQVQGGNEFVVTKFCNLTPALLRDTIRVLNGFGDARATPLWLFRLLMTVRYPPTMTRQNLEDLLTVLSQAAVNAKLKEIFGVPADRPENQMLPLEYLQRWVISAVDGLTYIYSKTRLGFEFNYLFDKLTRMLDNLRTKVDDMLLNLCDRTSVNKLAVETGKVKQSLFEACEAYVKLNERERKANVYTALQEFRDIEIFNFTNFRTINQNGTLWLNHFSVENADAFEANSIKEIRDAAARLTPLVKEIRGFIPSAVDQAREKAERVKIAVNTLTRDLDRFLDQGEGRTLAKAKSLLSTLNFYKEKCETLRVDGVPYDEENIGVTPQKFAAYYEGIFNFIADSEQEVKKQENRDRLEASEILKTSPQITLPPLRSIRDWLSYKAALQKIMPFHSSELVKCTIVRNSLRDRADISRCQNLNYEAIYNYLVNRYDDASLLPRLVDRLLSLKPARDNRTSYDNLTEFLSVYSQLELHNGTDRLDSFVREKLVSLLLPNNLECDFLASQIKQEREWKKELTEEDDDSASTTFSLAKGDQFEDQRRDNFVSSMKVYLEIIRRVATSTERPTSPGKRNSRKNNSGVNAFPPRGKQCPACNGPQHSMNGNPVHSLSACPKFRSMPVEDRYNYCVNHKYCKRCLCNSKDGKHAKGCQKSKDKGQRCKKCNAPTHHELICLPEKRKKEIKDTTPRKPKKGQSAPQSSKADTISTVQTHCVQETPTSSRADVMATRTKNAVRMFLSACSYVTVALPGSQLAVILSLLDVGAGLNLVLTSTAKRLKLRQIKTWHGTITTINGDSKGDFPVFLVPVKDTTGQTHRIAAIGIQHIGLKTSVPPDTFSKICNNLNISPNLVQQTSGPIELLIGLESRILLAKQSNIYDSIPTKGDFPGVAVYETILSPLYMIIGAVGPTLADDQDVSTRMYTISTENCFYTDMIQENSDDNVPETHNHEVNVASSFFQQTAETIGTIRMPDVVTMRTMDMDGSESPIQTMALLDIKKTAATLSHLDAAPLPDLVCPGCKLILEKCNSCKYLNAEASIKDLEELAIIKANMKKVTDPEDPNKFYIFFDYVFREDPKILYAPQHTNKFLGKKSALRLRQRLLKEGLMDMFHAEMEKSIKRGHFAEVTGQLKKRFDALQIENYINFNYVLKSSSLSQACRPVSDSTAYHKNGDLNSKLLAGIQSINNPLHIVWKFLYGPIGFSSDFSRAYRSVLTGDVANAVRRFYWFSNPLDEDTLIELCLIRLNYGDSCSSAVLEEAIRCHIAPECKTTKANHILSFCRYVDDTLFSFHDEEEMETVREDIIQASAKANFLVKHTIASGSDPVDEEGNEFTNVLAMQWYFKPDLLTCNIHLNTHPKRRGRPTGPDLNEEIAMNTIINKTIMCRLAGEAFSYTQSNLLPITMCLRIIFSKVSTLTKDWTEDVSHMDEEFTAATRKTLTSLVDLHKKVTPMERAICPRGFRPWRVCISSDGSSQAAAATIHVVVRRDDGTTRVTNVAGRGKIVRDTVPNAELIGAYIAVNMMQEYIVTMDAFGTDPIEILLLCDSLCLASSLNPMKLYKSVKVRNTCFAIHKSISDLYTRFPNVVIKYVHVKGTLNPSDGATKHVADPVAIANSDTWRHGAPFYTDQQWPSEEIVFLQGDIKNQLQFKQPVAQQHAENGNNCVQCYNSADFCGRTYNYCQECHGSDTKCMNAEFHVQESSTDKVAEDELGSYKVAKDGLGTCEVAEDGLGSYKVAEEGLDSYEVAEDGTGSPGDEEFPIPPEEKDDYPGILDYDTYVRIIINSRSLIKVIHVVCILLHIANFIRARREGGNPSLNILHQFGMTMVKKAWRVILRSSQCYFPPEDITMWFSYTDGNNILKARTRFMHGDHPGNIVCMTSPPIISHKDHRLTTLIIRNGHVKFISHHLYNLHLQKNITIANVRNSIFAVEITRMKECVKKYIKHCVQCLRMRSQPLTASLSTPRWLKCLQTDAIPWRVISVDPIGDYSYMIPNSRGPPRKAWILVVSCLLTTAVACYTMTGISKMDIYNALFNHFQRYVEAKIIYSDAGSALALDYTDPGWERYFGNSQIDIINLGTEEFYSNFVESKVKLIKKMLKASRLSRTANKLPTMTMPEITTLFETFSNLLNSRPIFATSDGSFILSPNHIIKNWISLERMGGNTLEGDLDDPIDKLEAQLQTMCKSMRIGAKLFMENLKYSYLSDTRNYQTLQQQTTTPRKGDIVMVSRRNELPLGVVEHVKGQFCWIRRKKNNILTTERINFRKIYILHRPYQKLDPPGTASQVYQLRNSRGRVQTYVEEKKDKLSIHIVLPHPFDDCILDNSYLYYYMDEDGTTHILPRAEH